MEEPLSRKPTGEFCATAIHHAFTAVSEFAINLNTLAY